MTHTEIIERLKKAGGSSRELDCAIFVATAESPFVSYYPDCVLATLGGFAARLEIDQIERFTGSLDAAIALVERLLDVDGAPEWGWSVDRFGNATVGDYRVYSDEVEHIQAPVARRALALLIALFTALQHKDANNG